MTSSASSALSRYRPSVIATATLAAAGSIYLVYCFARRAQEVPHSSLHRSNAVRRRHGSPGRAGRPQDLDNLDQLIQTARQALEDATDETNDAIAAVGGNALESLDAQADAGVAAVPDEAETEQNLEDPAPTREGTRLQELVYAIAKNNSEKEGIVHRGVTCDKCSRVPIVGVRYHCANCPDYDLCEDCEATDCHLKTHVFYKVKVPSPWGGKKPLPLWYPGDPTALPSEIEDRAYKNRLSSLTGFSHSKIDGLYQQFTCMANVPVDHPDQSSIRMGIDRSAFDHCFIGQTMTDRPPVPNLIHDRLFYFYDSNYDGIVDFSEFVIGTSLVHNKTKHPRNNRVFRALDLDNNGCISRKDCLKIFRAYYELNKDIMLGYLGIEREGENADLVLADREPARHVSSGRSLASYFNEGTAGGQQINSGTSEKVLNIYNDYIPHSDYVNPITGDETTNAHDLITKQEVTENGWLNLFAVFNDEIFRLCGGKPLKWLNGTQVRLFARTSLRGAKRDMIEHNGQLWAADAVYFGKSAYLRIEDDDIRGIWTAAEFRSRLSDPTFHLTVHAVARHRLCLAIREAMLEVGKSKQQEREKHSQFYLGEEPRFSGEQKASDMSLPSISEELQDGNLVIDDPVIEVKRGSSIPQGHVQQQTSFVGASAAAHTIYNVVEEALIELLDPLFKPSERLFLEVQKSASKREKYRPDIAAYIRKSTRETVDPIFPRTREEVANYTKIFKDNAVKSFFGYMNNPDDIRRDGDEAFLRSALGYWITEPVEKKIFNDEHSATQGFMMWLLEIEAELMVGWRMNLEPQEPAQEMQDGEGNASSEFAAPDRDPTMPQHRPSTAAVEEEEAVRDDEQLSQDELLRLARLEAAAENIKRKGGPGLLDFGEFERKMELTEDNGNLILQWIGGWVDLVMF